jgi:Protein of unknown function (DUF1353)
MNDYFPLDLFTKHLPDGTNLEVSAPFKFRDPVEGDIDLDAGDTTDLASIPRIFWAVLPPHGRYKFGAVIHDKLYRSRVFGTGFWAWRRADKVLWRAMLYAPSKVSPPVRAVIYLGLLAGGWWTYFRVGEALVRLLPWKR